MALLPDALFHKSASRRQFKAFALATLPLLVEAAVTFTVCGYYLLRRPPATIAVPTSIKSIFFLNVLLTLLLLCATLFEGFIVSAQQSVVLENDYFGQYFVNPAATDQSVATPVSRWSAMAQFLLRRANEFTAQRNDGVGAIPLDMLALGLVWIVVAVYVVAVARVGLRMACQAEGEKVSWSLPELRKIMYLVNRSKWLSLCFALFFSTCFFHGPIFTRSYFWTQDPDLAPFLLQTLRTERVWRWTAASSMFILLADVSLFTIATRSALYVSCKRFSLQKADDELENARSPLICSV